MESQSAVAPSASSLPQGWGLACLILGVVMTLDGLSVLVGGSTEWNAATIKAAGQALCGPCLALSGHSLWRNGQELRGKGVSALFTIGGVFYIGGLVAGSTWWQLL